MKKTAMPLYEANLCANCETVFSYTDYHGECPACLSMHSISLTAVLNPTPVPEFNIVGTQTGRWSSSRLNMIELDRRLR